MNTEANKPRIGWKSWMGVAVASLFVASGAATAVGVTTAAPVATAVTATAPETIRTHLVYVETAPTTNTVTAAGSVGDVVASPASVKSSKKNTALAKKYMAKAKTNASKANKYLGLAKKAAKAKSWSKAKSYANTATKAASVSKAAANKATKYAAKAKKATARKYASKARSYATKAAKYATAAKKAATKPAPKPAAKPTPPKPVTPPPASTRGQILLIGAACSGSGGGSYGNWVSNLVAPADAVNVRVIREEPNKSPDGEWEIAWDCDLGW